MQLSQSRGYPFASVTFVHCKIHEKTMSRDVMKGQYPGVSVFAVSAGKFLPVPPSNRHNVRV